MNSNNQPIICPRCNGRRVVFDPLSICLGPALLFALLVEAGQDEGITKRQCPTCRGKGTIGEKP